MMTIGLRSRWTGHHQLLHEVLLAALVLSVLTGCLGAKANDDVTQSSPLCAAQGLCTCYNTHDPPACYDASIYHCTGTSMLSLGAEPTGQCAIASSTGVNPSAAAATLKVPATPQVAAANQESEGLTLLFNDDFKTLDSSKWGYEIGDGSDYGIPGWGNAEFECYTTDPANAAIIPNPDDPSDGVLRIRSISFDTPQTCINRHTATSQKTWTSAKLTTKDLQSLAPEKGPEGCQPIVIESRIKLPMKQGHWAAFWMLPQDYSQGWPRGGEIDIMEHINLDIEVLGTVHLANADGNHMQAPPNNHIPMTTAALQGFNTYKLVWGCDSISWYVNGDLAYTLHKADLPNWPFDKPFYITLNLAVGGNLPGFDVDLSGGEVLIDYVRVYTAAAGTGGGLQN